MEIKTITVDTDLGKIGMGDYIVLQYQNVDEIGKVQGIIAGIDCRANPLDFRLRVFNPLEPSVVTVVNCEDIKVFKIVHSAEEAVFD